VHIPSRNLVETKGEPPFRDFIPIIIDPFDVTGCFVDPDSGSTLHDEFNLSRPAGCVGPPA
jgi:hypothetical protein